MFRYLLLLSMSLMSFWVIADPVCMPKQAGGTGTEAIYRLVYIGGTVSENPADAQANGGTLASGGKAVTWWCPREVFGGFIVWDLEWYGWEFAHDQFMGMQGFRPDDPEIVRQAWRATRSLTLDRTYFPTNVLMAATPSRPETRRVQP